MHASMSETRMITAITIITVIVFVLVRVTGYEAVLAYAAGFIPARVGEPGLLDNAGLGVPLLPNWLTPLGATLLHGGWMHLGFNMLILLFCGRQVEMVLGGRLTLLLYAVGAYAAAAGQWMLGPNLLMPMIGASGSISAIIAAYALLYGGREVKAWGPIPAGIVRMLWLGAGWIGLQFLIGVATSSGSGGLGTGGAEIAIGAHIGGFVAGMLLVRPLLLMRFGGRQPRGL